MLLSEMLSVIFLNFYCELFTCKFIVLSAYSLAFDESILLSKITATFSKVFVLR